MARASAPTHHPGANQLHLFVSFSCFQTIACLFAYSFPPTHQELNSRFCGLAVLAGSSNFIQLLCRWGLSDPSFSKGCCLLSCSFEESYRFMLCAHSRAPLTPSRSLVILRHLQAVESLGGVLVNSTLTFFLAKFHPHMVDHESREMPQAACPTMCLVSDPLDFEMGSLGPLTRHL